MAQTVSVSIFCQACGVELETPIELRIGYCCPRLEPLWHLALRLRAVTREINAVVKTTEIIKFERRMYRLRLLATGNYALLVRLGPGREITVGNYPSRYEGDRAAEAYFRSNSTAGT